MSSVSDPPPSTPSPPPVFVDTSLNHEATVKGSDFLRDDRVSINDYLTVTKTAYQNSKELLQEVEQQKAELAAEQGLQLGLEASSYSRLLNALALNYQTNSVNAAAFSAPIAGVNSAGSTLNSDTFSAVNIDAVTNYNQAVTDFAAAQSAFDSSPQQQGDIDTYNAAVASFNAASTTYNSAMTGINGSITAYNAAIDTYNVQVDSANALIAAENIIRESEGKPPLPLREPLLHATAMPTGPTISTFPPGGSIPPTNVSLPGPVTADLIDYNDTSFDDVLDQSGFVSAKDAFENFEKRTTDYQEYTTKDLKEKPQKQQKDVTNPDAYVTPENSAPQGSSGPGSTAGASASADLGDQKILGVLTKLQIKQLMVNFNLTPDIGVQQSILALAAALSAANIVPAANAPSQSPLVSSLATLAGGIAQSQSGTIDATVSAFVQNAEEFKNLNEGDKKLLSEALGAAVKTAVLLLGAAGLAGQIGGASVLSPALATAQLQGDPGSSGPQFALAQKAFNEAQGTFGQENVAATAGRLASEELAKASVNSQTAFNIGTATGNALVQNGIGNNQQDLVALVQTAAKGANGEELPDEQAQKLARALLLLGLGSAFQVNAENNLILKLAPEEASQIVEQATIRLFGFSPDFSQATIVRRDEEPKEELSFARELETQVEKFRDSGDKKVLDSVRSQLDNFTKTVDDLGAFLTNQFLDPGNTFEGLMYGSRGSEFKRGSTDINVS